MRKFHDPDVNLKNYGGQQIDFMAQIELSLSQGDREITKMVLVRKDAPNDLLMGTDIQPELGFSLVVTDTDGKTRYLLEDGEVASQQNLLASPYRSKDPDRSMQLLKVPLWKRSLKEIKPL